MNDRTTHSRERVTLEAPALQQLIDVLRRDGHQVLGPVLGNGAIVYDELASIDQLPAGQTDQQEPGVYKLVPQEDAGWFGYTVGPHSWKRYLFPPVARLWRAERKGTGIKLVPEAVTPRPYALVGVRACELAALSVHDRVFLQKPHIDPVYKQHREQCFIVAVNCGKAGGTCFCASMGTGPKVERGHDIVLTEVVDGARHYFVADSGSEKGAKVLSQVATRPATKAETAKADGIVATAATHMGRSVQTDGLQARLARQVEHPHWEQVAKRCMTCANCTMVCPTCFCATIEDETDLSGAHASRMRKWDSCFTLDFSYIHGGSVRPSPYARYRQWLTHKFSTWVDQFGTFGCVGCGRCITWCPVGIDVTEEVRALGEETQAELSAASAQGEAHAHA